jgi:hypothetical protein
MRAEADFPRIALVYKPGEGQDLSRLSRKCPPNRSSITGALSDDVDYDSTFLRSTPSVTGRGRRWKNGDILQVETPAGFRFLRLIGKDHRGIQIFQVLGKSSGAKMNEPGALRDSPTLYYIESAASVLASDSRFSFLGNLATDVPLPMMRRRFLGGWFIVDGMETRFVPIPIDDCIASLSLDEGLPPDEIVRRLCSGWRPQDDRGDIAAEIGTPRSEASLAKGRETTFYLAFESQAQASTAIARLKARDIKAVRTEPDEITVTRRWAAGESLEAIDSFEIDLTVFLSDLGATVCGRETCR